MGESDVFWNASHEDLKRGYIDHGQRFMCLLCGKEIEKGIVYVENGMLYEAYRFMELHIETIHHGVFEFLLNLNKKLTGLPDY